MIISLSNIHLATEQQVFDQVAKHLLTQAERCTTNEINIEKSKCRYRNYKGHKCAGGCLIADDEYNEWQMEGHSWVGLVGHNTYFPNADQHFKLVSDLQKLHDVIEPASWLSELYKVTMVYNLNHYALLSFIK